LQSLLLQVPTVHVLRVVAQQIVDYDFKFRFFFD